jgi:hypothetical protein
MTTTPAPADGHRALPRARRAQLPESAATGLVPRAALARELGITERTLMTYVQQGLPVVRVGGLVYFRAESVRAWFAERETVG